MRPQSLRIPILGGLCLVLTACTHASDGVSLEQSVPSADVRMMALAPEQGVTLHGRPIATLPDEQVASVKEHGYVDGLRQDILLKGGAQRDVQNSVTILARTSRRDTLDEQVPLVRPTEPQIRSEIGGAFPHLDMRIAERESRNSYGSYGLALGRAAGDVRCAYMWQWIDENRLSADAALAGPVSIRVRLCQTGVTFDAMAAEMDHLTIGGPAAMQQAAAAPLGVIEAPTGAREPVSRLRSVHGHKPRPSAHRVAAHRALRQTRVARREEPVAVPADLAPGPRYMGVTPVSAPIAQQAAVASAVPKLAGDLPAQAYLGPSASTGAARNAAVKYY